MIGNKVQRIDGVEKVTGRAIYGDDIKLNGLLHAACRYTDIPAGKIKSVDISKAQDLPGVRAIALFEDVPGDQKVGPIRADQLVIVNDEVFYSGDVIAVVAADTRKQAQAAADHILVEYEPFTPISDPEEAIKEGARLVHSDYDSNVVLHYPLRRGDVDAGFADSDTVLERTYRTGFHEHAYIETESLTAVPAPSGKSIDILGSIQNPYTTRRIVSAFLGMPLGGVVVKTSTLGGSFGGKDDTVNCVACRAALMARITGRPVKLTLPREESIKESYKRHPYVMTYKAGFTKEGILKAMKIDILVDSGAYSSQSFFVTWRSVVQATGPYAIPNVSTDITTVYTNNTYTGAYRGYGSPQIIYAQESLMDEIASVCGISPIELRKRNGYKQNDITATGQKLSGHTVSLTEVMEKAADSISFEEKRAEFAAKNAASERFKYGIGMACSFRGCSLGAEGTDASCAMLRIWPDGSISLGTAVSENGQGLSTTMCMTAAEALGVEMDRFQFLAPQTDTMPDGGPTVASRGTIVGGNAVIDAARQVKEVLFDFIKGELGVNELAETSWADSKISAESTGKSVSFDDAVARASQAGCPLDATGWFHAPEVSFDEETGQGNAYFTYVYGCQIAEVKLDSYTGKLEVIHISAAHDAGKVINPLAHKGQIYGGIAQGMGYGIFEDYNIQNGDVKSLNFDEYLIPTIKDMPTVDAILVENPDADGPYGAKSIGEPTLELTAAAVNNAFASAAGTFNYQQPLTLEQAFLGYNLKKPSRASEAAIECHHSAVTKGSARITSVSSVTPDSLQAALDHLKAQPDSWIISGGTDVMIQLRKEHAPRTLLNVYELPELNEIRIEETEISIGAAAPIYDVLSHPGIQEHLPLLCRALGVIGSRQIRNRGTIGGNIANAAPCADSVPPLLNYQATVEVLSAGNSRLIPLADFITRNYKTALQPGELISRIIVPKPDTSSRWYTAFFKLGRRNALNITRISASVLIQFDDNQCIKECRFATGSLFNRPCRIPEIEQLMLGKKLTAETISSMEEPLDAIIEEAIGGRWSSAYKKPVFINMARGVFNDVLNQL